jgi:glycosyltransferase involved in cell wall biosynthesis
VAAVDVTVVIPTRDRLASLLATLAGVWRQSDVQLEVVIVDDGSRPEVAAEYEGLCSDRVRVLRNAESRGPGAARNAGIAIARGQWVAFLDDDDLWAPSKLRRQLDAAERARRLRGRGAVPSTSPVEDVCCRSRGVRHPTTSAACCRAALSFRGALPT